MCGIVGYVGEQNAIPVLLNGLRHLEYRGYDSAGIACLNGSNRFFIKKEKGKIAGLEVKLKTVKIDSRMGIGHTRWATHGEPSRLNAHPHLSHHGDIVLVHNGIIENYTELKEELKRRGYRFHSDTDTEVAAHLIESYYHGDLARAVRRAVKRIEGFFAFVVMARSEPDRIIAVKRSNPLVVGVGKQENFIASDVSAILPYTDRVIYIEDDEMVEIKSTERPKITDIKSGKLKRKSISRIPWSIEEANKAGRPHFMLKEIFEQPDVIARTLKACTNAKKEIKFEGLNAKAKEHLRKTNKIHFVSCGTAYHAGLCGRYMFEEYARVSTEARVSSEFRYSDPILGKDDVAVFISQSGETADTLAALREAKKKKAYTISIVNVVGSTIARESDSVIYTYAGPEIGVASTKAYVAQLLTLSLLSFYMAGLRKQRPAKDIKKKVLEAWRLCHSIEAILKDAKRVEAVAKKLYRKHSFLFLGRGYNFPSALEGALKLKEITYAHAHGYAAGEMKHGPIALIDDKQPVVCLAPASRTYEKMISNIEEISARKGIIIAVATQGDKQIRRFTRHPFLIPPVSEVFSPILTVIPLQLFAYYIAVFNGRDVDQPRNLAKSVTVE